MSKLPKDWMEKVKEAMFYLEDGGLGEVMGFTYSYAEAGFEKIQNDTSLEYAILLLAAEALDARKAKEEDK